MQYDDNIGGSIGATLFVVFKANDLMNDRQIFVGGGVGFGATGAKCIALAHSLRNMWIM